jgi:hypothetical protein
MEILNGKQARKEAAPTKAVVKVTAKDLAKKYSEFISKTIPQEQLDNIVNEALSVYFEMVRNGEIFLDAPPIPEEQEVREEEEYEPNF